MSKLIKFSKRVKAAKSEYQKLHRENAELKKYIVNKQKQQQQQQQQFARQQQQQKQQQQ